MDGVLTILKLSKEPLASLASHVKPPNTKLPQLNSEITSQQFQKFRINWDMFTKMTNLPTIETYIQLYNCADKAIQNSIINAYSEIFHTNPSKLFDISVVLVTQKSNPIIYRISFLSIVQSVNEFIQNYLIQLWSEVLDCNFICPNYDPDLFSIYIKDLFIWSIANDALQVDMLAKSESLKTLKQNISHTKIFAMAI